LRRRRRRDLLLKLEAAASSSSRAARAGHSGERLLEDVLEAAEAATAAGASARTLETTGPEAEGLEHAFPAAGARPAAAEAFETLEARLAVGVDLATVERLALVGVADDLVGGVELGKARGRLGVVLVGVGVMFLGEFAERALDLSRARTLGYPQDVIGVTHSFALRGSLSRVGQPPHHHENVGSRRS
jgi:hypothetical protein